MRVIGWTVVLFFGTSIGAWANQRVNPSVEMRTSNVQRVKLYSSDPDLQQPILLPGNTRTDADKGCKRKLSGQVSLFLIVDANGLARNIIFDEPSGTPIDDLAIIVAKNDRFKPATIHGLPVASPITLKLRLSSCVVPYVNPDNRELFQFKLHDEPTQSLSLSKAIDHEVTLQPLQGTPETLTNEESKEPQVSPPKMIRSVVAQYSDEARKKDIEGTCVIQALLDEHGMPRQLQVVRKLDPGLDANAILAAERYRFIPAMRDGEPMPLKISIEIRFRLR